MLDAVSNPATSLVSQQTTSSENKTELGASKENKIRWIKDVPLYVIPFALLGGFLGGAFTSSYDLLSNENLFGIGVGAAIGCIAGATLLIWHKNIKLEDRDVELPNKDCKVYLNDQINLPEEQSEYIHLADEIA